MRDDCKYFQTRTYRSGDVARFCVLDLAPEAPWRCPEDCPRYSKRVGDAGFRRGDLVAPSGHGPDEPALGDGAAELLGAADEVISAAGSEIMAEETRRRREEAVAEAREPWWQRLRRQPPWRR